VVQECEGDVRKWNIAGLWMSIFSVRHFILVVDEPGATEVVVPRTVRACQVVLLAVLAGVTWSCNELDRGGGVWHSNSSDPRAVVQLWMDAAVCQSLRR